MKYQTFKYRRTNFFSEEEITHCFLNSKLLLPLSPYAAIKNTKNPGLCLKEFGTFLLTGNPQQSYVEYAHVHYDIMN